MSAAAHDGEEQKLEDDDDMAQLEKEISIAHHPSQMNQLRVTNKLSSLSRARKSSKHTFKSGLASQGGSKVGIGDKEDKDKDGSSDDEDSEDLELDDDEDDDDDNSVSSKEDSDEDT